jgi:type IV secretion system protein TrbL
MIPDGRILDDIVRMFGASAVEHVAVASAVALSLFTVLAALQLTWDGIVWALSGDEHLVAKAVRKVFLLSFFYTLIAALPLWLPPVLGGFEALAQEVTGLDGLTPSSILGQGFDLGLSVLASWKLVLLNFITPHGALLESLTFVTVIIAFAVISYQMARVLIEGALVLGGLVVFVAASGHRVTFGLFEGFLRYALDVGVRLFVVYLAVSTGQNLGRTWTAMVDQASVLELADPRFLFTITLSAAFYALVVWSLPKAAAQHIVGSFSLSGQNPLSDRG